MNDDKKFTEWVRLTDCKDVLQMQYLGTHWHRRLQNVKGAENVRRAKK
jgi:hypothetical protein